MNENQTITLDAFVDSKIGLINRTVGDIVFTAKQLEAQVISLQKENNELKQKISELEAK